MRGRQVNSRGIPSLFSVSHLSAGATQSVRLQLLPPFSLSLGGGDGHLGEGEGEEPEYSSIATGELKMAPPVTRRRGRSGVDPRKGGGEHHCRRPGAGSWVGEAGKGPLRRRRRSRFCPRLALPTPPSPVPLPGQHSSPRPADNSTLS